MTGCPHWAQGHPPIARKVGVSEGWGVGGERDLPHLFNLKVSPCIGHTRPVLQLLLCPPQRPNSFGEA